jgi:hypothetical protein
MLDADADRVSPGLLSPDWECQFTCASRMPPRF